MRIILSSRRVNFKKMSTLHEIAKKISKKQKITRQEYEREREAVWQNEAKPLVTKEYYEKVLKNGTDFA